jgi:hypothetical protein
LKTIRELQYKLFVSDQQRSKSSFRNERVVETQYHEVVIDDVKGMAKFPGVADAGDVLYVSPVLAQKRDELRSRSVCKNFYRGEKFRRLPPCICCACPSHL